MAIVYVKVPNSIFFMFYQQHSEDMQENIRIGFLLPLPSIAHAWTAKLGKWKEDAVIYILYKKSLRRWANSNYFTAILSYGVKWGIKYLWKGGTDS